MSYENPAPKPKRVPFDPETMGFGKHTYQHFDPEETNVMDFATNMRGEEQHYGDVRQYNSGSNEKHPENDATLDWLSRLETVFETDAPECKGTWKVTDLPIVKAPEVFIRVTPCSEDGTLQGDEIILSTTTLGVCVDEKNFYPQVVTKILTKGKVARITKEKIRHA